MAKVSGLTCTVTIGGNDISNDIISFDLDTPYGVQDVTGVDKSAAERLLLRADATGSVTFVHNTSANRVHATLKTPGIKTVVLAYPGATATFSAAFSNYSLPMAADGSLVGSANFALSSGTAVAWT